MRCEEKSGFLMMHNCENVAESHCYFCGKALCAEHAVPYVPDAAASTVGMPTSKSSVVCRTCQRERVSQAQQPQQPGNGGYRDNRGYDDPYYHYPYYGGYHPYYWGGGYDNRDRQVFDRNHSTGADSATGEADVLGS